MQKTFNPSGSSNPPDPLELRIAQLSLPRVPAHWKGPALQGAARTPVRRPPDRNRFALAAAWVLIGLLQGYAFTPARLGPGRLPNAWSASSLSLLRTSDTLLEELEGEHAPATPLPRQGRARSLPPNLLFPNSTPNSVS